MEGFKKDGKFRPTNFKTSGVNGKMIIRDEKNNEIGVAKINFRGDANRILNAKKINVETQVDGNKISEETMVIAG